MSTTAGTLITDVLDRIRDPNGQMVATDTPPTSGTGQTFVLSMLSVSQIFVNLAERLVVTSYSQEISGQPAIYDMTSAVDDYGGAVLSCTVSGVGEIDGPVDYKAYGRASRTWYTDTVSGLSAPLSWAPIGKTLVAFYPTFTSDEPTAIIRYIQEPPALTESTDTLTVPDLAAEHVARLAELLCRIKTRQLTDFKNRVDQLGQDMGMINTLQNTGGKAD